MTLDQNKWVNNELKGDLVSLHKIRETEDIFFVVSKDFLNIKVVCFYISILAGRGEGTISWKKKHSWKNMCAIDKKKAPLEN